ncbi:MAG: hypothetical protein K9L17_12020 [Clostridiales bacterium]|nr:hypothetical protein [Clostridiales bacterium]MCF8023410.1 hypothetical protein [Clostridiales bacterium]
MQWRGIKIHVILAAMVIGLGLFIGGQWVYNKVNYQEPLEKALDNVECVSDYSINNRNDKIIIDVHLDQPENLMDKYNEINKVVKFIVNNRTFEINIEDTPDSTLKQAYYRSQFIIHEAIVHGNFTKMADAVHDISKDLGISAKINVGPQNIYFQMEHENSHFYKIITRSTVMPLAALERDDIHD